ncbi:MAG: hypothetical protein ACRECQ_01845 [Burkholderiaceae bacterium]
MLIFIALGPADAQQPVIDSSQLDCGSVVIIRCDRPATTEQAEAQQRSRSIDLRRQPQSLQQLDGVVIEADALRRRSIEQTMAGAFPILLPRDGNYTFRTSESSKCTCMNVCPPPPLPCCNCSVPMNRYLSTPGSSPLN